MSHIECVALGFTFGLMSAGFLGGLVACVAEWRAAAREGGES